MPSIRLAVKRSAVIVLSLLVMGAFPASAFAAASGSGSSSQGPTAPTGPDANTYTYDSTTGLWSNQYYTWNPATNQTTPITPPTYGYNPATGRWDTTQWIYNAASGTYVPNVVEVTAPPAGANVVNPAASTDGSTTNNTGPSSTNNNDSSTNNTGIFNGFYNASISNTLNANAVSGDATVNGNTTGGNATTGNASDIANIINLLQSSGVVLQGANLATFTANINGNVQGDLNLDPSTINTTGPLSVNNSNNSQNTNVQVNNQ